MKIVCDNKIPFLRGVLEPFADVVYLPGKETTPEVVKDADALITRTRTICNEALLAGSQVQAIATATIGFDHIDTAWCDAHGIFWENAPGCNSGSVKQYIASVLVTLAKRYGFDLAEKTLGVVGVGNVGRKVASVARALGMKVLLNDPPRARKEGPEAFVGLDEICAQSDIITVHVPLSKTGEDATWHLFDAARLACLRPDQILINSSRGPVVDNAALKAVLQKGGLKAAVLDVWEGEPNLDPELVALLAQPEEVHALGGRVVQPEDDVVAGVLGDAEQVRNAVIPVVIDVPDAALPVFRIDFRRLHPGGLDLAAHGPGDHDHRLAVLDLEFADPQAAVLLAEIADVA